MRVAILYICTGRYSIFWENFFTSCEKHFLLSHEKHYFVFTDQQIIHQEKLHVHRIEQKQLGWPDATLKRFHIFSRITDELENNFDFLVFFNANMIFLQDIGNDFLPTPTQQLVFHLHPGFFKTSRFLFPYERHQNSTAYIPYGKGEIYVCGGVNGGYTKPYLKMVQKLRDNIDIDASHHIIARWHDESHINRYILGNEYKINHPGYVYPDKRNLPFPQYIRVIDKNAVGGHDYLRGTNTTKAKTLRERFVFRPSFPQLSIEKPIILARLLGGLGNQMFIYAMAYALAKRLKARLALDTGALQSDKIRHYALHQFGLMDPQWRIPRGGDFLLEKWFLAKKVLGFPGVPLHFIHCPACYDTQLDSLQGNCYLTGYWQSPRYFANYADDIRSLFTCSRLKSDHFLKCENFIQSEPTVAVHLRRGDYLDPHNLSRHGILTLEYYNQARAWLERDGKHYQYLIFSDAPKEAEKIFSTWDKASFLTKHDEVEDLMLMRQCKHAIIANSSYSWWGAWLGETYEQKVVAPKQWFVSGSQAPFSVADLFPQHWKCL